VEIAIPIFEQINPGAFASDNSSAHAKHLLKMPLTLNINATARM
jgi:hypothetical protein